jgi:thioredoxin 1
MVAPILEELKAEFGDKLEIYKINTEQEHELSALFGVQSIPSLLFVPINGQPQMAMGALPKDTFRKAIGEVLNVI